MNRIGKERCWEQDWLRGENIQAFWSCIHSFYQSSSIKREPCPYSGKSTLKTLEAEQKFLTFSTSTGWFSKISKSWVCFLTLQNLYGCKNFRSKILFAIHKTKFLSQQLVGKCCHAIQCHPILDPGYYERLRLLQINQLFCYHFSLIIRN